MSVSQTKLPGTAVDSSTPTTDGPYTLAASWSNVNNVLLADGANASTSPASASNAATRSSHFLLTTNYGFTIPYGATIDGISVEVSLSTASPDSNYIGGTRIIKGGSLTAYQPSLILDGFGDAYWQSQTVGGAANLWSNTWTPADINSSNFGFGIFGVRGSGSQPVMNIDYARITVYYTPGPNFFPFF